MHYSWKLFIVYLIAYLVVSFLNSGCAIQMPVTEGLVFTEDGYEQRELGIGPIRPGELSTGISRIVPAPVFEERARKAFGDDSIRTLDNGFLYALQIPAFSFGIGKHFAVGMNVPLPGFWKFDSTIRFLDQYYLTVNRKVFFRNTEVILQRRLLYESGGGISAGIFYRYDPFQFREGIQTEQVFSVSWYGVRAVFQTPDKVATGLHLRGFVSGGYVPEFKTPMAVFGISVIIRSSDRQRRLIPPKKF